MRILALDVGTKRIGYAYADTNVRIAIPRGMIPVDGNEMAEIAKLDKEMRYYHRTDAQLEQFASWRPDFEKA